MATRRLVQVTWLLAVVGCSAQADEMRTLPLADLPAQHVSEQGTWESNPWIGTDAAPWLDFPGGVTLRIEHSLGYAPPAVLVYLSFRTDGAGAGLGAGNLGLVMSVDSQFIQVKNGTRSDMYARVVAH